MGRKAKGRARLTRGRRSPSMVRTSWTFGPDGKQELPLENETIVDRVRRLYEDAFPTRLDGPRRVGFEDEFAVVDAEGGMADVAVIFEDFPRDVWKPKRDAVLGTLIGVRRPDGLEIGLDVGRGTLEIGWPPVADLHDHVRLRADILAGVDARLASHGFVRLEDYACQPRTLPAPEGWARKARADIFRTLFVPDVHLQTLSASAQIHVELARGEVLPALELFLAVSPVLIALNANSPVWGGALDPEGMLAARQDFWNRFTTNHGFWGNVLCGTEPAQHPPRTFAALAAIACRAKFLVRIDGGRAECPQAPFGAWAARDGREWTDDAFRAAFLDHEGTLWWDARPRAAYGTVEVRPMCQTRDALASRALVLGLAENLDAALAHVRGAGSFAWWRDRQDDAQRAGLSDEGLRSRARRLVQIAKDGLARRGLGEEEFLAPLRGPLETGRSPAHAKKDLFLQYGLGGFLRHLMAP